MRNAAARPSAASRRICRQALQRLLAPAAGRSTAAVAKESTCPADGTSMPQESNDVLDSLLNALLETDSSSSSSSSTAQRPLISPQQNRSPFLGSGRQFGSCSRHATALLGAG